jgi:hypothetical protein
MVWEPRQTGAMTAWTRNSEEMDRVRLADGQERGDSIDAVDAYFDCITTCSLDDQECITVCTTLLRDQN